MSSRTATYIFSDKLEKSENKTLNRFLIYSLIIHIFALYFIVSDMWFQRRKKIEFESVQARLVQLGEERDKNLLPRITQKQPAPAQKDKAVGNTLKKPEPKKEAPEKEKKEQKKVESKRPPTLAELLAAADIKKDDRADAPVEGAKDGVKDGDVSDPALALKANMYTRKISALIRKNWNIPSIITKDQLKDLQTTAYFRITFSGDVYNIQIVTSSGNSIFDSSVIDAIKRTGSLPLPEDRELRRLVLKEGFECPFTPG
jgi:TonB family protein